MGRASQHGKDVDCSRRTSEGALRHSAHLPTVATVVRRRSMVVMPTACMLVAIGVIVAVHGTRVVLVLIDMCILAPLMVVVWVVVTVQVALMAYLFMVVLIVMGEGVSSMLVILIIHKGMLVLVLLLLAMALHAIALAAAAGNLGSLVLVSIWLACRDRPAGNLCRRVHVLHAWPHVIPIGKLSRRSPWLMLDLFLCNPGGPFVQGFCGPEQAQNQWKENYEMGTIRPEMLVSWSLSVQKRATAIAPTSSQQLGNSSFYILVLSRSPIHRT